MLKLVHTNSNPIYTNQPNPFNVINSNNVMGFLPSFLSQKEIIMGFLPHFTVKTHLVGPCFYKMQVSDPFHYLACELVLEIRMSEDESEFGDVVSHFPTIDDEYLEAFVWEDVTLINSIMTQFRIKILEQLLLFCANRNALKLVIHADYSEIDQFESYDKFIVHADHLVTPQGRMTALVIPSDRAAYDKLVEYREEMRADFHEFLWKNQHIPLINEGAGRFD